MIEELKEKEKVMMKIEEIGEIAEKERDREEEEIERVGMKGIGKRFKEKM